MIARTALWTGLLGSIIAAEPPPADLARFLSEQLGFTAAQVRALDAGAAVVRSLEVRDSREVAAAGAIQLRVPPVFFAGLLRDVTRFKRGPEILQIGGFSTPPVAADVAALTLDAGDREALARCRPGSCKVQLPAPAITRFQNEVRWRSPHEATDANRVMRETVVGLVAGYQRAGDSALAAYADGARPTSSASEFRVMVNDPPAVLARFPNVHRHLLGYPATTPGIDDVFYWSKEKMGPAAVITVTHLAIARVDGRPPVAYLAASKQLYGAHYFDTSLGLTLMLAGSDDADMYLVYVNRSRVDVLSGMFGGVKRAVLRSRMRGAVESALAAARREAERRFARSGEQP